MSPYEIVSVKFDGQIVTIEISDSNRPGWIGVLKLSACQVADILERKYRHE